MVASAGISAVIVRQPVRPLAGRMTGSGGRSSIPWRLGSTSEGAAYWIPRLRGVWRKSGITLRTQSASRGFERLRTPGFAKTRTSKTGWIARDATKGVSDRLATT